MNEQTSLLSQQSIELQGVRVHNLRNIDLRLPLHRLIVVSGVSGSGKSSLAFDTLYAEGQRRYIESFSPYARQFLDRLEPPDADVIEQIPPAIAIRQNANRRGARSTVATATEIHDYLRLLFAKIGRVVCPGCEREIRHDTSASVLEATRRLAEGTRFQLGFPVPIADAADLDRKIGQLQERGFARLISGDRTISLHDTTPTLEDAQTRVWVVVDRLVAGKASEERIADSVELAFRQGECLLLEDASRNAAADEAAAPEMIAVDGRSWRIHRFNDRLVCEECRQEFQAPEPRLFSFSSPLGACPDCQGFGSVPTISFEKLVPDPTKSLREGAIAAWTTPAYRHELDELLALADDYDLPVDVPFSELKPEHRELIREGVPERRFGGLVGFFRWLERHKYKLSVRVFLNRWRAYETCGTCGGDRLQPLALAVRVQGRTIADLARQTVGETAAFLDDLVQRQSDQERKLTATIVPEIRARLQYLLEVGLGYLTLDRRMNTLSGGESQRVALTAALGSSLVNTLYVLDEPSAGLHPRDSRRVINAILRLRDAGNTVVVVEHEEAFIRSADEVVEIGPGAGQEGGEVVFQGSPIDIQHNENSVTGAFLSGRRRIETRRAEQRRKPVGWLRLEGARQHNLKNLDVEFPLGGLCIVSGVSGSGKSTLVQDTLYPALCQALRQPCSVPVRGKYDRLSGAEHVDEVILVDQSPIGRSPRSNPVTYLKAFDEIRKVFGQTPEAKLRNFTARHFSFNSAGGGRCGKCQGNGSISLDMQFLADVSMTCPECHGSRYQREILEVKYRGLTIAEVLSMTVREAFAFFRGQRKLQRQLNFLKEVGLDYLPLGQPANTLSGGESQRLKLASFLASGSRRRTLFLLDEPTTGLHAADIEKLLQCFGSLLAVGHSLIVIEHHLDVIRQADYVIDLGPEAGEGGGLLVAAGLPEEIAAVHTSITGRYLREAV